MQITLKFFNILFSTLFFYAVHAQVDSSIDFNSKRRVVSSYIEKGFVMIQSPKINNLKNAHPEQFSVDYSTLFQDKNTYNLYGCFIRRGVSMSYVNFKSPIAGKGLLVGYFIEPIFPISKKLFITLKAELGLSYLNNPFGPNNAFQNLSYSTNFNSNIHASTGIGWLLSNHLAISGNANFHHTSNTAFRHPNYGINWITESVSLLYYPNGFKFLHYKREKPKEWKKEKIKKEFYFFYSPSQSYYQSYQFKRNYVVGTDFEIYKKMSSINEISVGAELYYNKIDADSVTVFKNNKSSLQAGIMIGHRFLMNRFSFSQQLGFYTSSFPSYNSILFIRLGLTYQIDRKWKVGINFKDHGKTADFLDLRLGFLF